MQQNAATVYAQILPKLTKTPLDALRPGLEAGAEQYDLSSGSLLSGGCSEALGEDVQIALRSSSLDWRLGFGTASESRFERTREALVLSLCLTLAGHRSARQGAPADAARYYFDGLAVGCDLGNGNETMLVVAIRAVRENLLALRKLAGSAGDPLFLRRLAADLSQFDGRVPDGHVPLRRTVLWTQNEVALQELETAHEYDTFGFIGLKQILAARALKNEQTLFDDATKLAQTTSRQDAARLSAVLHSDVEASANEMIKLVNLPRSATLAAGAFELEEMYRVVKSTIELRLRSFEAR